MSPRAWVENLFRPLVLALLLGALVQSAVELLRQVVPSWNGSYLVVLGGLVGAEAYYSQRFLARQHWDTGPALRYRAIEGVLIFVLLQLARAAGEPAGDLLGALQRGDFPTFLGVGLLAGCWLSATWTASDFARIGEPPDPVPTYVPPLESLAARFFAGGALLLALAGLTRIQLGRVLSLDWPDVPGIVWNVLIYFLLGIILLGQVHLTRLYGRWQEQGLTIAPGLPASWARYSIVLVLSAAGLAFVLPTRYTVGLLDLGKYGLSLIFTAFAILLWLIALLATLLFAALGMAAGPTAARPPPPPALPTPPAAPGAGGLPSGWFELLQSGLFWIVILAAMGYVGLGLLHQQPRIAQWLAAWTPLAALRQGWGTLRGWLRGYRVTLDRRLSQAWARRPRRRAVPSPPRRGRAGGLLPGAQVRDSYLRVLERAGRHGYPRGPTQTPTEYSAGLAAALPQVQEPLAGLTQAFVEARYSAHPISPAAAEQAWRQWQQVDRALDEQEAPRA
ncbi:MAG TPA: DUF4129 domain-containing protein [Chloroflexia bacterium]|nr:DUF4129 domain-containing protein [Chloroflexia bacterium]